jgi:hypothetical protein
VSGDRSPWPARIGAWLFVGIPLAWGVAQVAVKSVTLFR